MTAEQDRCGNTIHSNYVSDHRCQRERGHSGDCLFGGSGELQAAQEREKALREQLADTETEKIERGTEILRLRLAIREATALAAQRTEEAGDDEGLEPIETSPLTEREPDL